MSERSGDPFYLVGDKFFSLSVCKEMDPDLYFQSGAISMRNYADSDPNQNTGQNNIISIDRFLRYRDKKNLFFAEFVRDI
jgi:hypothetical protein